MDLPLPSEKGEKEGQVVYLEPVLKQFVPKGQCVPTGPSAAKYR